MLTKLQIENLYKVQFPNNDIQAKPLKSNDLRIISIGITSRSLNDQKYGLESSGVYLNRRFMHFRKAVFQFS